MTTATALIPAAAEPNRSSSTRTASREKPLWKTILSPLASLRVTVVLLALAMILVFAGTSAQKELSIFDTLHRYFYAWWCWVPFKYLAPLWGWAWDVDKASGKPNLPGGFFFPGGYFIIVALLANLLAAHSVRFKFTWKRSGILMIHFGLILLLVGELLTSAFKHEAQMTFREGETRSWAHVIQGHDYELAIVDTSKTDVDDVVVIGTKHLKTGEVVKSDKLPFDVRIDQWYPNSSLAGPMQTGVAAEKLATAGDLKDVGVIPAAPFTGVEAEQVDTPAAFATFTAKDGVPLGTYMLTTRIPQTQQVKRGDKTYDVSLRFERIYLPYSLELIDFAHDKYAGSEMARNFSSRVRLVEPARGVNREVTIRMNEPLRYEGRTLFQSGFDPNDDKVTTLQVVANPAWQMPYIACIIGTIGLLTHFGMHLVGFLRKRAKSGELFGSGGGGLPPSASSSTSKGRKSRKAGDDGYTLAPRSGGLAGILVPLGLLAFGLVYVASHALVAPHTADGQPDVYTLGQVPVMYDGRVMPLDSLARTSLKIIHGKESFEDENGKRVRAIEWLANVMAGTPAADHYRVFRIDHPQIKSMLGLDELTAKSKAEWKKGMPDPLDGKNFSFEDIFTALPNNGATLQEQIDKLKDIPSKRLDLFQNKLKALHSQVTLHVRLSQAGDISSVVNLWSDPERGQAFNAARQAALAVDPASRTPEQEATLREFSRVRQQADRLGQLTTDEAAATYDLFFVPPAKAGGDWRGLGRTFVQAAESRTPDAIPAEMTAFLKLLRDFRGGDIATFNSNVAQYQAGLNVTHAKNAAKAEFEAFFNRFDPFTTSIVFYIGAFLFVAWSWLGWQTPMWRTGLAMLLLALAVHSAGLVMRVYISGRPPVTNLYSSAVFIAWGVVVMALILEVVFRNGLGIAAAAVVGVCSLLIADGLSSDGDTMQQLQAVLDTNFWLATHVIVITLGYASTFLAMGLAMFYVLGSLATPHVHTDLRKNLVRMVYGILCFAMMCSFVGTILGGIWADQSWGRFWGWDPKENGAVLIVLWVAMVLHARWGGMAKERGVMLLTVAGGIVTGWSWFGTNMMGVGLHSYGFMEKGTFFLGLFVGLVLTVALVGLIVPQRLWWSRQNES